MCEPRRAPYPQGDGDSNGPTEEGEERIADLISLGRESDGKDYQSRGEADPIGQSNPAEQGFPSYRGTSDRHVGQGTEVRS
jgi:hypothetical protein